MRLELNTVDKTITLEEMVNVFELLAFLKTNIPEEEVKNYSVRPGKFTDALWLNPVFIPVYHPFPSYPSYPAYNPQPPFYGTTSTSTAGIYAVTTTIQPKDN